MVFGAIRLVFTFIFKASFLWSIFLSIGQLNFYRVFGRSMVCLFKLSSNLCGDTSRHGSSIYQCQEAFSKHVYLYKQMIILDLFCDWNYCELCTVSSVVHSCITLLVCVCCGVHLFLQGQVLCTFLLPCSSYFISGGYLTYWSHPTRACFIVSRMWIGCKNQ